MKFFAIFAVLVAAAAAKDFSNWSLYELSNAIQNPDTDPALLPALEQALNDLMDSIYNDKPFIPDLTGWTLQDLSNALQDPNIEPFMIPHLEHALNQMMDAIHAGIPVEAVGMPPAALEVSYWNLHQLSEALQNPNTDPAMIPFLEQALNEMMDALISGHPMEVIAVVAPAGVVPAPAPVVIPAPVEEPEEVPAEIPTEIPAEVPAVPSSPLVQIIVNVQQ